MGRKREQTMCSEINKDGNIFNWDGEEVDALELVRCLGLDKLQTPVQNSAHALNEAEEEGQVTIDGPTSQLLMDWMDGGMAMSKSSEGFWVFSSC